MHDVFITLALMVVLSLSVVIGYRIFLPKTRIVDFMALLTGSNFSTFEIARNIPRKIGSSVDQATLVNKEVYCVYRTGPAWRLGRQKEIVDISVKNSGARMIAVFRDNVLTQLKFKTSFLYLSEVYGDDSRMCDTQYEPIAHDLLLALRQLTGLSEIVPQAQKTAHFA